MAGTCERVRIPNPRATPRASMMMAGPVAVTASLRASSKASPRRRARRKRSSRWMAKSTPMPSVMPANIEVATPSGIPIRPITAKLISTASAQGSTQ